MQTKVTEWNEQFWSHSMDDSENCRQIIQPGVNWRGAAVVSPHSCIVCPQARQEPSSGVFGLFSFTASVDAASGSVGTFNRYRVAT
jgi:hypothetical protein